MTDYSLRELVVIGEYRQEDLWDRTVALQTTIARVFGGDVKASDIHPYQDLKNET